jgi:hypothetical protein
MGIFRLHKNVWEKASGEMSEIRDPEPIDLWDLDGELDPDIKRRKLVKKFELDFQTRKHSSVCLFPFSSYRNYL